MHGLEIGWWAVGGENYCEHFFRHLWKFYLFCF